MPVAPGLLHVLQNRRRLGYRARGSVVAKDRKFSECPQLQQRGALHRISQIDEFFFERHTELVQTD
jgi:hypothetical protein